MSFCIRGGEKLRTAPSTGIEIVAVGGGSARGRAEWFTSVDKNFSNNFDLDDLMTGGRSREASAFPLPVSPTRQTVSRSVSIIAWQVISTLHFGFPKAEIWIKVLAGRLFLKNLKRSSDTA